MSAMSIYTDENNELVISITEWCKNNPLDLSEYLKDSKVGFPGFAGMHHSDETKAFLSEIAKGKKMGDDNPMRMEWVKQKHKAAQNTEENKRKRSKNKTGNTNVRGKSWFNNGVKTKMFFDAPDDTWKPGRLNPHWNYKRKKNDKEAANEIN